MDETTRLLIRARRRLSVPQRWTKGATARDARGRMAHPLSPAAVRWCAMGALHVEGEALVPDARFRGAVDRLMAALDAAPAGPPGCQSIPLLNDTLGHGAVLDLYDRAIRGK